MGVSINHVASMAIPTVAGAIWVGLGYERLFLGATVFAVVLAAVASLVPRSGKRLAAFETARLRKYPLSPDS